MNFLVSYALTKATGNPEGYKVPDKVLAEALRQSGFRKYVNIKRADNHKLADVVEALCVYAWLNGKISQEEIVTLIAKKIEGKELKTKKNKEASLIEALSFLIRNLFNIFGVNSHKKE